VPSHVGTLASPVEYDWTCVSFDPPESTNQTENRSVQPLLHSSRQKVPILNNERPCPLKIAPSRGGSGPHLIHDSLGQSERRIQMAPRSVQPFSHRRPQSSYILYKRPPLSRSNLPLPMGGSGHQSNTWFPWSTRVLNQNGISIGSVVFAGLVWQTDRPTDQAVRAMRSNNLYILNTVRCPYDCNGGRGRSVTNDVIMRTRAASAVGARRANDRRHVATGCTALVLITNVANDTIANDSMLQWRGLL